jgi:hypothetical protein
MKYGSVCCDKLTGIRQPNYKNMIRHDVGDIVCFQRVTKCISSGQNHCLETPSAIVRLSFCDTCVQFIGVCYYSKTDNPDTLPLLNGAWGRNWVTNGPTEWGLLFKPNKSSDGGTRRCILEVRFRETLATLYSSCITYGTHDGYQTVWCYTSNNSCV